MGFISASSSFTRFRIVEPVPDSLVLEIDERLRKFSFRDIDNSAEERSFGWVSIENLLDTRFHSGHPQKGEFLAFTLRLDTRRLSPAVFKKHLQIALEQAENEVKKEGRKFLSRDRKKEIKEQVRLRLMTRTLPVPAVFDVVWSIPSSIVYLATANSKIIDLFERYFTDTFELHLEPLTPYHLAMNLLGPDVQPKLDAVEPAAFII